MSDQLTRQCPFCGSSAVCTAFMRATDDFQGWQVECSKCGAAGPMNMPTEADAIGPWNRVLELTRTPPASEPVPEVAGVAAELLAEHPFVTRGSEITGEMLPCNLAQRAAALLSAQAVMLEEARRAMRNIKPYLEWTVSDESPGRHPTMPSAVGAFLDALAMMEAQSHVG